MELEQTNNLTPGEAYDFHDNENNEVDLPPEYCHYRDEGCEFASSCLNCPLAKCIYDERGGRQQHTKRLRNSEIARLFRKEGKGVRELASMFGVSQRTVQRVLKGDKE